MNLQKFMEFTAKLKDTPRTGWLMKKVSNPESVSDHMHRVALLALILAPKQKNLDINKCIKMALVHDLCEAIVGDIANPYKGNPVYQGKEISREEKSKIEFQGLKELVKYLEPVQAKEIKQMFLDVDQRRTAEGEFVDDLDKLELAFQTLHYENNNRTAEDLNEFFEFCKKRIKTPILKKIMLEIEHARKKNLT